MHSLTRSIAVALLLAAGVADAAPWTYRGTLNDGGAPANGRYDFRIALYTEPLAGKLVVPTQTLSGLDVKDGLFSAELDLDTKLLAHAELWLAVEVGDGQGGFVPLDARTRFDPKAVQAAGCWDLNGNAGTSEGPNFIGTTDDEPLILRVNGSRVGKFAMSTTGGGDSAPTITMGSSSNYASGAGATIAGGGDDVFGGHSASGQHSTISGGVASIASGFEATVAGGSYNEASGSDATVLGGTDNCAGAPNSVALGREAKVRPGTDPARPGGSLGCNGLASYPGGQGDIGSFVWSSGSGPFITTGPYQFLVRAQGGVGINAAPLDGGVELTVTSDADGLDYPNLWLKQKANNNGILMSAGDGAGSNNAGFHIDHYNGSAQARRFSLNNDGSVLIRSNITQTNSGVTMAAGSGSWSALSDRNVKTAIEPSDTRAVLDKLVAMPVSEWSYIAQGEDIRHIGPMAQDFSAAFGVGENDTTISTVDADGVALAAIQGLNQKLETELAQSRAENAGLQAQLQQLADRLAALEAAQEQ